MSRDATSRLGALVERCKAEPGAVLAARDEGDALAIEVEGDIAFAWRLAVMRAAIAEDGDTVRELYGELIDRYRDDPPRLGELRVLGDEIRRLEADGALPSVLVARSDRRKR